MDAENESSQFHSGHITLYLRAKLKVSQNYAEDVTKPLRR
jgi:hypothetical protein